MKKFITTALVMLGVAAFPLQAHALFTNIGFETGDFTGWTIPAGYGVPSDRSVEFGSDAGAGYGTYFAKIQASDADTWIAIVQTATLEAGTKIDGAFKFDYLDEGAPHLDEAIVQIQHAGWANPLEPYYVAGESTDGWLYWSWTAPEDGSYTLSYAVKNVGDEDVPSYGFFDTKQTAPNAVPEPMSLTLMAGGLAGLALRRFKR
ncbi:MAG TPA: PEP-CTERM sorting domain-containing protein [Candidatus Omnitrophota bacterium]|nr:PEP-CTERM sorting domain-containing protein [Candidatus Omnitrophota bacterium]